MQQLKEASSSASIVQVLGVDVAKGRRVMVFCNTLDSCRATEHYLREKDIHTCCYHGDIPLNGRREAIQEFTGDTGMDGQPVLVCTDLAARYMLFIELQWLANASLTCSLFI